MIRHKDHLMIQAISNGSIVSIFVYIIIRILFYEFPMSWTEEISFFIKISLASCLMITVATVGTAWLYRGLVKIRRK